MVFLRAPLKAGDILWQSFSSNTYFFCYRTLCIFFSFKKPFTDMFATIRYLYAFPKWFQTNIGIFFLGRVQSPYIRKLPSFPQTTKPNIDQTLFCKGIPLSRNSLSLRLKPPIIIQLFQNFTQNLHNPLTPYSVSRPPPSPVSKGGEGWGDSLKFLAAIEGCNGPSHMRELNGRKGIFVTSQGGGGPHPSHPPSPPPSSIWDSPTDYLIPRIGLWLEKSG